MQLEKNRNKSIRCTLVFPDVASLFLILSTLLCLCFELKILTNISCTDTGVLYYHTSYEYLVLVTVLVELATVASSTRVVA